MRGRASLCGGQAAARLGSRTRGPALGGASGEGNEDVLEGWLGLLHGGALAVRAERGQQGRGAVNAGPGDGVEMIAAQPDLADAGSGFQRL